MQYSIVDKSRLERTLRLDSEYFLPYYLELERTLLKKIDTLSKITDVCKVSDGNHFAVAESFTKTNGIPYYRGQDLADFFMENITPVFIPDEYYNKSWMKRSHFNLNDILLSIVGTVGSVSLITDRILQSTGSCKIAILRPKNINSYYLGLFLSGKFGKYQINKNVRGAVQTGLILEDMDQIMIYNASINFQNLIEYVGKRALLFSRQTTEMSNQAQSILLSELGLENWKPEHKLSFIENYSDVKEAERFDADYFQPKYEEINCILAKHSPVMLLENLCSQINYGTVPTSPYQPQGIPYIKGLNLVDGFIEGDIDKLMNCDGLQSKFYVKENDIVISQMGTVGKAGIIEKEHVGCLFASFTIRIRLKNKEFIDPYVLTLYINEIARPYYLLRRIAQASVRQNTDLPTIRNMPIPTIKMDIQENIRSNIKQSKDCKQKSKALLEIAKRGVEMAIEQDEDIAEKWIKEECGKLGVEINA